MKILVIGGTRFFGIHMVTPYNGVSEYSINTEKAQALGFRFSRLRNWIFELLDYYIQLVR